MTNCDLIQISNKDLSHMAIKSDSPDKRMKEIFAYVLEFMLTFDKMQNTKIYQNATTMQ